LLDEHVAPSHRDVVADHTDEDPAEWDISSPSDPFLPVLWDAYRAVSGHAQFTALDALTAAEHLVFIVNDHRAALMEEAYKAGATWARVAEVSGMTPEGVEDWYLRRLADRALTAPACGGPVALTALTPIRVVSNNSLSTARSPSGGGKSHRR
jgi:hypothetical protein